MEGYEDALKSSKEKLQLADHILNVTYSHLKDPKILLLAAENLHLSCSSCMEALLSYSLAYKKIESIPNNFYSKLHTLRQYCSYYGLDHSYVSLTQEIKEVVDSHKNSPMEFPRKSAYIICDDQYNFKMLSRKDLEKNVEKAKLFINRVATIISDRK
jgi:hypothetical protein